MLRDDIASDGVPLAELKAKRKKYIVKCLGELKQLAAAPPNSKLLRDALAEAGQDNLAHEKRLLDGLRGMQEMFGGNGAVTDLADSVYLPTNVRLYDCVVLPLAPHKRCAHRGGACVFAVASRNSVWCWWI